ncbi:hypothetical protein QZH41_005602 [Actinostola sp. cb2023]|nr:hypothetical protein QZH41_005602 [Actinostola sp. cb2023]
MTGLVNRHTSHTLPLKASSIFAEVNGFAARLLATLTYCNDCEYDVEGLFVYPQDERTTIVEFEATIEERHVSTDIREKTSISSLKSAYSIEEREDDLFSLSIGRIPPLASVFVQVGLITELLSDHQTRGSLFVLPSVFTPRLYTENESERQQNELYGSQMLISDLPRKTHDLYSFDLQLEVVAPCLLAGCSSRTHAIQVDADSRATNASRIHITIAEPHTYDREIEVLLHLSHPFDPYVLIEEGKKILMPADATENISCSPTPGSTAEMIEKFAQKPAIMINFTPQLKTFTKHSSELIFLVDRSGSMSGKHIFHVKETLILFLKSLPSNVYFNIVGFGSYYRCLFQSSQEYNEETLQKAMNYVHKMRADLGGTNLILPLEFIFDQPSKRGRPRTIFLLTDGGVSNTLDVVDLIKKYSHSCRFFSFGIGPEACPHLVQGVAGPTTGKSWFITEEERIPPKVMEALNAALRPAITDIEVSWHLPEGYDVIQSPSKPPFVFDGERLVLYGILSRPPEEEKESPKTPQRRRMDRTMRSFSNNSVKVFWFDDDMEFLPEEQLLLEINQQERLANEENDSIFIEDDFGQPNCTQPQMTLEETSGINEDHPKKKRTSSWRFRIPSEENDVAHDIAFGNFFKDLERSCENLANWEYDNDDKSMEFDGNGDKIHKSLNARSKNPHCNKPKFASEETDPSNTEQVTNTAPDSRRNPHENAREDEETAYQQSSRYYERDSGVGFSMDDSDKLFEEESVNNDIDFQNGNQTPPSGKDTITNSEDGQWTGESKFHVIKNSELLGEIGVPKNFAAVCIKGFVGEEEIEQVSKRKVLTLERKGGFTTGLGRRLPTPEGSDHESMESEMAETSICDGEEPTDLYRLDRSPTIDSSDNSPVKSASNSPGHKTNYARGFHLYKDDTLYFIMLS